MEKQQKAIPDCEPCHVLSQRRTKEPHTVSPDEKNTGRRKEDTTSEAWGPSNNSAQCNLGDGASSSTTAAAAATHAKLEQNCKMAQHKVCAFTLKYQKLASHLNSDCPLPDSKLNNLARQIYPDHPLPESK